MSRELLDEIAGWNRERPLTKEELSGFGRAPAKPRKVSPYLDLKPMKTGSGKKALVPFIGVKVKI